MKYIDSDITQIHTTLLKQSKDYTIHIKNKLNINIITHRNSDMEEIINRHVGAERPLQLRRGYKYRL